MQECYKAPALNLEEEAAAARDEAGTAGKKSKMLSWIPVTLSVGQMDDEVRVMDYVLTAAGETVPVNQASCRSAVDNKDDPDYTLPCDSLEGCNDRRDYDLFAAVFHIRDAKSCGSLVAVIHVSTIALERARRYICGPLFFSPRLVLLASDSIDACALPHGSQATASLAMDSLQRLCFERGFNAGSAILRHEMEGQFGG